MDWEIHEINYVYLHKLYLTSVFIPFMDTTVKLCQTNLETICQGHMFI